MSDPRSATARRKDDGFTLIELLISIVLSGVLTAALSATILVIVRQQSAIAGRFNDARSENGVGFWVPADLSSADQPVDNTPTNSPCFTTCPAGTTIVGSNAFLLAWSSLVPGASGTAAVTKLTRVSYRYALVGKEYQLIRVQCDLLEGVQTCTSNVVAHNLAGPPDGSTFVAGSVVPDTVIKVTAPLDPSGSGAAASTSKNAQLVLVTISGGGAGTRATGGSDTITLGASGTDRTTIGSSNTQTAPNLVSVRSKCGGLITLVVDESASISTSDFAQVKSAVTEFVTMFAGTPVRLSIVPFDTYATALGTSSSNWTPSYNMLDQTQVDTLLNLVNSTLQSYVGQPYPRGGTNWEDALYHVFYKSDGTVAADLPDTLVFFTDGVPTFDRLAYKSSAASATPPAKQSGYADSTGTQYAQQSFNRADLIADQFRGTTQFIGVGVGSSIDDNQTWVDSYPGYHYDYSHNYHYNYTHQYHYLYTRSYHYTYSHGYHYTYTHSYHNLYSHGYHYNYTHGYHYTYTHGYHYDLTRWYHIEKAFDISGTTINRGYHIERLVSGVWSTDPSATSSTLLDSTHRVRFTTPFSFFKGVTTTASATADMAVNWATLASPTSTNLALWQAQSSNTSPASTSTDGWTETRTYVGSGAYWEIKTDATSTTAPSTSSGWRVSFSSPWSLSAAVLAGDQAVVDGATDVTTVGSSTNQQVYAAEDNGGSATDHTDGWTRGTTKNYTTPFPYADTDTVGSGYSSTDASWTKSAKQYTSPYTATDNDTVGAGYSASDPAWTISAKQYSSPFTAYDTNTSGSGYSASDPTWSVSKQYTSPFTLSDAPDTVGAGYSASDPSWAISAKQFSTPYTAYDTNTDGSGGYSSSDPTWTKSAKQYSAPFTGADTDTVGSGYSASDPSWAITAKQFSAPYTAYDTNTDGSGGYSSSDPTWTVSAKQYSAPFTTSDPSTTSSTGYSSTDPSWAQTKDYTAPFTGSDSDTVGSGYSATDAAWTRSAKQYTAPYVEADVNTDGTGYVSTDPSWTKSGKQYSAPYTAYDTGTTVTHQVSSDKILSRLIAASDTGVRATSSNGTYTNAAAANMYILPQWDQFAGALKAIGLASCGGTLTLQTKVGTSPAADPFKYSKYAVVNSAGVTLPPDSLSVTTSSANPSGTFDLNVTDGTYVTVEIEPADMSNYTGYSAGTWSCKALGASRSLTTVPITGSVFTGFKVRVAANEAVSCTQAMSR
ncbi:MAG: hypothetical protein JWN62_4082 [Acidimicrobiales bacterium]|nr:hypothetical protein [Acidimicrobiales bacterium]